MPLQPTDIPSRQGIQDAIDEAVAPKLDAGSTTANPGLTSIAATITLGTTRFGKQGFLCSMTVIATYTGANRVGSATGDLGGGDLTMFNLPAGWRPAASHPTLWIVGGSAFGGAIIQSNGNVTLTTLNPSGALNTGNAIQIGATWIQMT